MDDECLRCAVPPVQRREVGAVVRDPPRRSPTGREAPGIDEVRVEVRRDPGLVRDQRGDGVRVALGSCKRRGSKQSRAEHEIAGQGLGFVDVYDAAGSLLQRVAQHGQLNAPWGLALAPSSFGRFGGELLVGNFGDGEINAYEELPNGHFEHHGALRGSDGRPLAIDGLWALRFGNGGNAGPTETLFFTAGPDDESHGLLGSITAD